MKRRTVTAAILATPILWSLPRIAPAATAFINIGSGSTAGLYYPTAVGMAGIVNDADVNMRAYVRVTGASVANCRQVGSGELQMGLTQNNIAFYAYNGQGVDAFAGKPEEDLRGMIMLYPEVIHILVRKLAGINSIADLQGKRVYVGDFGSGTEQDVMNLLAAYDMTSDDFRVAVRGNAGDAVNLLRDDQIDAMFYTVGVGAAAIIDAMRSGRIDLLDVPAEKVEKLHDRYPFYTPLVIPAGTYPRIDHEVSAVTLKAMLIGSAALDADVVHAFMNTVFDRNLDKFYGIAQNPNLRKYFELETALQGMPIPMHAGAARFFRERDIAVPSLRPQA
ncbi:MAG TPA: TAXI family TRAP transporter solute-binding subunit [Salinisphaeraceae bacterium]|nr:TAXI family TRAP transporter solute-binding subunit [Salinisphaeraceae bacterium]